MSDGPVGPQLGKEPPPAELRISAPPRPGTRLSRRVLVAGSALAVALVFAALWYALDLRSFRLGTGPELYNTNAKPTDALSGLQQNYADLTRPKPPEVPQPGPQRPPDLGQPVLPQPAGPTVDPEAERRRREREQAAVSAVLFTISAKPAVPVGAAVGQEGAAGATSGPDDRSTRPIPGDDLTVQNGQADKDAFLSNKVDPSIYSPQRTQVPASPYELMAGSVIAAALVTGINSDLPGEVVAQVTEDVYDTVTGRTLLIPQGTRLIGKYDSHVTYGQERVLLIWTRLIMPDGRSIVLDNLPATDTQGYAGLDDGTNYHTWRLLKGIALSTVLGIGSALATNNSLEGSGQGNIIVALGQSGEQSSNQAGQRIVSKDLAVQPTLTVRPGYPVRVLVNRDVVLQPYAR